jgi:hypothetical protein
MVNHCWVKMKINELINSFEIWTTNEESELLERLKNPIKLSHLNEHDKVRVQTMIRKSLVTKIGFNDPSVVANEK